MKIGVKTLAALAVVLASWQPAAADKLDDVIDAGTLRCAVVLDFPPIGYRDENNQPAGFDVEYCADLAKALDVEHEILEVTWSERLPAIVQNRADVVFGGTSDTLQRAQTVGFSIPYAIYYQQAIVSKEAGIRTFEDLRGKRVAAAVGTTPEIHFLEEMEKRGWDASNYQGYQSENEVILAVSQGKADAGISPSTTVSQWVRQHPHLEAGPLMPFVPDYTSVVGPRKDFGWLNYLNLFITHQVRAGRYAELWRKYVGGAAPRLVIEYVGAEGVDSPEVKVPGVYY